MYQKRRHTALGEPSKYEQRRIPCKFWYLCQTICHSVDLLDKKCHIFTWIIRYAIPRRILEELQDQSDENVTHIEHLIKSNIEVCNTPLLKPVQFPMLILHPFDKSRI